MHDLLPGARQYGRAIVGSTHWGNHLVQRAVEDLSGDPDLGPSPSQAGLLHGVSRLWNGWFGQHMRHHVATAGTGLDRHSARLAKPTGFERQAALLTEFHQLDDEQAANILNTSPKAIADACQDYRVRSIRDGVTVLIIEDDLIIAEAIKAQIETMGHHCSCIAKTESDALESAFSETPDLIISDIKLADGTSGLDATRQINASVPVPTIYLTAYPELVLTSASDEPEFVLAKPYNPAQLNALVKHVLHWSPHVLAA